VAILGNFSVTYLDYSNEKSNFSIAGTEVTAGNIAAQITAQSNLKAAVDALSLGVPAKREYVMVREALSNTPPNDPDSQREYKWLVRFTDTVAKKIGTVEIPCARRKQGGGASLLVPGSDMADLTKTEWTDFKTAFEAYARSIDGYTVTMLDAQLVGRNI
jgi:hypothetical protein